jgi:hypothetical protein
LFLSIAASILLEFTFFILIEISIKLSPNIPKIFLPASPMHRLRA